MDHRAPTTPATGRAIRAETAALRTAGTASSRARLSAIPLAAALGLSLTLAACGQAEDAGAPLDGQDTEDQNEQTEGTGPNGDENGEEDDGGTDGADTDGADDQGDDADGDDADEGADSAQDGSSAESEAFAAAEVEDSVGNSVGTVSFTEVDGGVEVHADVQDLDPGFHGLHIHENGECEPQSTDEDGEVGDFNSAGGHLPGEPDDDADVVEGEETPEDAEGAENAEADQGEEVQHPEHAGDLPNLLITEEGDGVLTTVTDRLTEELFTEDDGTAVIIHSEADNHGNIPERYAPQGPDEDTMSTGDAGDRTGCGVVETQ